MCAMLSPRAALAGSLLLLIYAVPVHLIDVVARIRPVTQAAAAS